MKIFKDIFLENTKNQNGGGADEIQKIKDLNNRRITEIENNPEIRDKPNVGDNPEIGDNPEKILNIICLNIFNDLNLENENFPKYFNYDLDDQIQSNGFTETKKIIENSILSSIHKDSNLQIFFPLDGDTTESDEAIKIFSGEKIMGDKDLYEIKKNKIKIFFEDVVKAGEYKLKNDSNNILLKFIKKYIELREKENKKEIIQSDIFTYLILQENDIDALINIIYNLTKILKNFKFNKFENIDEFIDLSSRRETEVIKEFEDDIDEYFQNYGDYKSYDYYNYIK